MTCEGLRDYACDYYHHVEPFPSYLADLDCVWKRANCAGQYWLTCWTKKVQEMRLAYRSSHMRNRGSISPKEWARAAHFWASSDPRTERAARIFHRHRTVEIARGSLGGLLRIRNPGCHVCLKKRRAGFGKSIADEKA